VTRVWWELQAAALRASGSEELNAIQELPTIRHFCREQFGSEEFSDRSIEALQDWLHVTHGIPLAEAKDLSLERVVALLGQAPDVRRDPSCAMDADGTGPPAHSLTGTSPYVFSQSGQIWLIRFMDEKGNFSDLAGFGYIAQLLCQPHKPIEAITLAGGGSRVAAAAHTPQPILDEEGKRAYKKRYEELTSEIDEARRFNDRGKQEKLQEEGARLLAECQSATGLGGKPRRLGPASPQQKARSAVGQAMGRAYKKLRSVKPPLSKLAAHLKQSIQGDGTAYVYHPVQPIPWEF
jgi:hypothetical protein